MRRGSVRSICAIFSLVHNQMGVYLLHSVSLCLRVSQLPLCLQRSDYTSVLKCKHSLVGTLSCTSKYHMDAISSGTKALFSFSAPASIVCLDVVPLSLLLGILSSMTPLYVEYFGRAVLMSGAFRHSWGVLYGPCPAHIDIDTLTSSGFHPVWGGFALGPSKFHSRSYVAVAELFFMICATFARSGELDVK